MDFRLNANYFNLAPSPPGPVCNICNSYDIHKSTRFPKLPDEPICAVYRCGTCNNSWIGII